MNSKILTENYTEWNRITLIVCINKENIIEEKYIFIILTKKWMNWLPKNEIHKIYLKKILQLSLLFISTNMYYIFSQITEIILEVIYELFFLVELSEPNIPEIGIPIHTANKY